MNLNPLVFEYKKYDNCPLATMLSAFLSGIQRLFIIFPTIMLLVILFDDVENWDEALIAAIVMFVIYVVLRTFKLRWTDKLALKEAEKNS